MNNFLDRHSKYLRYLLLLSLITFAVLFVATTANGAWYPDSNWQYRKQIRIDGSKVSGGPYASFPVLIQLASDTDLAADAQNDGDDILFTSSDEMTKIPHEIESFNGSTGALVAWVKVSLNANPTDTIIYMYYGYGSATNQQDATNVWDSNYLGVYHLKEDPSGTAPQMKDSTSYGNHGTSVGTMTSGDQVTGMIGGSLDFDGSNDEIRFSNAIIGDSTAWTVTVWMKVTDTSGDKRTIYSEGDTGSERLLWIRVPQGGSTVGFWYANPAGNWISNIEGSRNVFDGQFHHVAMVQRSKTARRLYVDTVSEGSSSVDPGTLSHNTASIGMLRAGYYADWFKGIIDEVRLSNIERSTDWRATEYNNQAWPNTAATPSPLPSPNPGGGFVTVYSETTEGGGNPCGANLVMVVGTDAPSNTYDSTKQALFESWGWTVTSINDTDSQTIFNNAAANNDVMYISESSTSGNVSTKARDLDIGIVDDECWLWDAMEYGSTGDGAGSWGTTINIADNSHYITSPFSTGSLTVYSTGGDLNNLPSSLASGGQLLGQIPSGGDPTLFAFDTGATLDSGTAANRRVGFPSFDTPPADWDTNLETLLQRSVDWAAGCGASVNPCGTNLVMVTVDGTTTTDADDAIKAALFQSWGWTVTSIADDSLQATYDTAAANNDVMYIAESSQSTAVGTKARDLTIGVVVDEDRNWDDMGFASGGTFYETSGTDITILDNSHYITSPYSTGSLSVYSPATLIGSLDGVANFASEIAVLGTRVTDQPSLFAANAGAQLIGLTAPARRVGFYTATGDANNFTSNTETLLQRSLDWAAGCGADWSGGTSLVPAAVNDSFTTDEDVNLVDNVLTNDTLGDAPNTVTEVSGVSNGVLTLNQDGSFTYDPDVGFSGTDSFTYQLTDNDNETSQATVTITVTAAGTSLPNLEDYSCNLKITINSAQVADDLNDFPVLISLTDDSLTTSGCGFMTDPDGDDIVFTDSSKTTQLDHEIEKYDETTGELVAWVEVPFVSGSSNTDIYLYFGNSNVTSPQNDPTGVWDSNYKGVWHLKEDAASGTSGTYEDRISYDEDDSEETISSGSIDWTSSDLELGEEGSAQIVGMRWRNVTIPQGAIITSAYIEFTVDEVQTGTPVNLTFWGEGADNAAAFQNATYNISSAHYNNKTSASVAWDNVPGWDTVGQTKQSPEIKTIIQEIIDRPGWVSGNALVVLVTGSGRRTADSHNSSPSTAALLHVDYTTGATDFHLDSTSNDNDGIPNGNTLTASGKIDGAQDFDGTNDWIKVPHSSSLNPTGDYSVELWVNYDTWEQWDYLVGKGDDNNSDVPVAVQFWEYSGYGTDYTDSSNNWCGGKADSDLSSGNWYHITVTYDASANRLDFYRNGQADGSDYGCDAGSNTLAWGIGADGLGHRVLDGRIDEVRISHTIRSAAWVETSYNNQNSPSSFYSVEKNCPTAAPPISEFTCSIPITILGSKVSGTSDLINFPVLISLTDIGLKTTANCGYVENSNGSDIIFSDATQTTVLDHEIEKYDGGSGELVAWVRVPTLSATSDTTIYLHFGRSGGGGACEVAQNPEGVWDSNYVGVWHLKETPGTDAYAYDSTSNDNDASFLADVISSDQVEGKIGGALDFDGTSNDRLRAEDDPTLGNMNSLTVETWIKLKELPSDSFFLSYKSHNSDPWFSWQFMAPNWDSSFYFEVRPYTSAHTWTSPTVGTWYHVVGVYPHDQQVQIYVNGVNDTKWPGGTPSGNIMDSDSYYYMGWNLKGVLDEFRVSTAARSADWIQTEYNNQSDPSSFYSVGSSSCLSLGGFSCSRRITIDSTKVEGSSDLTNFPFLIKIQNDCNLKTAANGGGVHNSSGWDIVFADSDGTTQLDHEIEDYDGTSGDLTAWVRVPTLPYNSDKDIYMYYGKSGLTCNPSNPTGVWDSSYEAVYHLNDDFEDSTSHNRDATAEDTGTYGAVIADGEDFGPQDEIAIGNWNFSGDELTLQAWARFDDFDQDDPRVFSKANGTSAENHVFMLGLGGTSDQHLRMRVKTGTDDYSGTTTMVDTDDPLSSGNWYLIAGTYDGSNMRLLLDGVQVHSAAKTGNLRVNSWDIALGNHPGNTSSTYTSMDGKLDEVRILSAARSADWLRTEYNNQSDPDSFYSMSQDTCGGTYGFNFQYCKKIVVDHTQVSGSLTRYPLLINITGDDDLKTEENGGRVQHSQGWDIVFKTSGCVNYDHEIEKYDGVNGDLVAWVQIPTLSSSTDTEIYMYYGANVICDTSNPTDVWDARFRGVYHLNDDFQDSTQYNHDGTNNGTTFTASKIGNGALFDPSDGWDYIDLGTWDMSTDDITLQAWVWPNDFNQGDPRVVTKCSTTGSGSQDHVYMLSLYNGDNGENRMRFRVKTGTDDLLNTVELFGTSPNGYLPTAQSWHFLAATYENDVNPQMRMYRDEGLDAGTMNHSLGGDLRQNSWPVWIGASPYGSSNTNYSWDGIIDEVRILSSDLSQEWLATEYRNHNDPGNFYSVTSCFEQTTEVTQEWVEEVQ